jgi:hypothetical protein
LCFVCFGEACVGGLVLKGPKSEELTFRQQAFEIFQQLTSEILLLTLTPPIWHLSLLGIPGTSYQNFLDKPQSKKEMSALLGVNILSKS